MSNSVVVKTFGSEIDAQLAKEILEANGIKASVVADDMAGWFPTIAGEIKLTVLEEDAAVAQEILNSSSQEAEE
jgi:hypothetical protein